MVGLSEVRTGPGDRTDVRADVAGLRLLAVILLVLAQAGQTVLPGGSVGVDVVFVLSGFLVTGLLVREWTRTGRISLTAFYARRLRRLLPAATLVLAASLPLALLCLPRARWADAGWDVVASGLYVQNWRLAGPGVEQLAAAPGASILQHYWALAVAGQFLLLWPPLMLAAAVWAARRAARPRRPVLLLALGVLAVASFAWSIRLTTADPGWAYLASTTRCWELALGCGLALAGGRLARLPRRLAAPLGWAGLAAIAGAALTLRPDPYLPGYLALLPALGAVAVIAAGAGRGGPGVLLRARPVRAAGTLWYPLYLWYWPLLVAAQARFGELSPGATLAVLAGAALLAFLTHRYVETPFRTGEPSRWGPALTFRSGALVTAAAVVAGMLFQLTVWPPAQPPLPAARGAAPAATRSPAPSAPGAAVLGASPRGNPAGRPVARVASITPKPTAAERDLPDVYRHGCVSTGTGTAAEACVYGDRESDFTVALAGDTQAANWVPALQAVAAARKWRLVTYLKVACPFLDLPVVTGDGHAAPACGKWQSNVRAELTGPKRPKLLVTTSGRYLPVAGGRALTGRKADKALATGMRRTWSRLIDAGVPTVVLRDTPAVSFDGAKCVAANLERLTRCSTARKSALAAGAGPVQEAAVEELAGVPLVDLNNAICPTDRCASVIGGVLVYRDRRNLTASYARTLAPRLRTALNRALDRSAP